MCYVSNVNSLPKQRIRQSKELKETWLRKEIEKMGEIEKELERVDRRSEKRDLFDY